MKEYGVLGLFLVQSLCSTGSRAGVAKEACWAGVYKVVVDFVEHSQADLLSSVVKNCPLRIFEHGYV